MPKQVHNIRVRVTDRDKDLVKSVLDTVLRDAAVERKDVQLLITSDQDPDEPLYIGELWFDHQPPVRKILALLATRLSAADKKTITEKPLHYLDTGTHCFLKLDKAAFLEGKYELTMTGSVVHLRLNIAAFPATKENAAAVVHTLFAQ